MRNSLKIASVFIALLLGAQPALAGDESVLAVYLTWQSDPTTTMTVQWHTPAAHADNTVSYRPHARIVGGWQSVTGTSRALKHSDRLVHWTQITGLEPDTMYEFRIGDGEVIRKFRTMPAAPTRPIRFAESGDVMRDQSLFERMNKLVAARDPDFVIFGGDLAHDNGQPEGAKFWYAFLDIWQRTMIAPDGRTIPLIVAIGNHETPNGGFDQTPEDVLFFYELFAFPGMQGYNVLDFGKYLSLILLDTKHTHPVSGEQTDWLDQTLAARADRTHVFCIYHVPAWPAARNPGNTQNRHIRQQWVPVFEKHRVDICFEHHDHTFKRTHPIRDGQIDPHGVVYLGDGGYALNETRRPKPPGRWWNGGRWYLARSGQTNFFWLATLDGDARTFEAVDPTGHVFDTYTQIEGVDAPTILADTQGDLPLAIRIPVYVLGGLIVLGLIKSRCGKCNKAG